jgi:hypothetical protein
VTTKFIFTQYDQENASGTWHLAPSESVLRSDDDRKSAPALACTRIDRQMRSYASEYVHQVSATRPKNNQPAHKAEVYRNLKAKFSRRLVTANAGQWYAKRAGHCVHLL